MATTATDNYDSIVFGMLGGRKAYEQSIAALVSFVQLQPDESVLELCCGTGISTGELLRVNQNITAVELNKERIQRAKESLPPEVRLLAKDALELTPETDGRYDVVMCINGFYHFNEADFYALAERMLKPGGRLVFNAKLKDHNGVPPIHQTLTDAISRIIHEMRLFGRNPVQPTFIDRSYIKSAIEPETFTVPPPFIMSRHEAQAFYFDDSEKRRTYYSYWRSYFFGLIQQDDPGDSAIPTSRPWWLATTFEDKFDSVWYNIPPERMLAKAELFIEARIPPQR
ncbi:MAG: class I SAM-dependent methyltransferase [Candidatus Woesearchaeota archaeon]|nr:class I SAM-dependent methyltransferase [Candidatus Woesearchaeota archaeon]